MNRLKIAFPILIGAIGLLTAGLLSAASVFGQIERADIKEIKIKANNSTDSPHQIDNIEVEGSFVEKKLSHDGKYFEAKQKVERNSEWAKNLKFTYTNSSNQDITFLNITLVVQHPTEPGLKLTPTIFLYGSRQQGRQTDANVSALKPAQTITVQIQQKFYDALSQMFDEYGLKDWSAINEATIEIYQAEFADGSMWMYEGYFDPDPNNPQEKIQRVKKRFQVKK
jgi:hypothetical protein